MTGTKKLTDGQVAAIRALRDSPGVYGTDLAKKYGVSTATISRIWSGERRSKRESKQ